MTHSIFMAILVWLAFMCPMAALVWTLFMAPLAECEPTPSDSDDLWRAIATIELFEMLDALD